MGSQHRSKERMRFACELVRNGRIGQLIAFVPSLNLAVTRQTGSGGSWQYEEYLRRACAVVVQKAE
jgi:hypothetical protein